MTRPAGGIKVFHVPPNTKLSPVPVVRAGKAADLPCATVDTGVIVAFSDPLGYNLVQLLDDSRPGLLPVHLIDVLFRYPFWFGEFQFYHIFG